jgi:pimeloyl-ACP methyl ester carboxylesterase
MNTRLLWIALVLLVLLLLAGCSPKHATAAAVPEGAQAGELTGLAQCEFQAPGSKTKYAAECGTLVVPENWDKAGSRLIALPVVRIPASGPNPAEPVFWLVGGPGGTNLSWAPPDWLLKNHDVVEVGYRGADGTVMLSCPEVGRLLKAHLGKDLWSEQARLEYVAATKECAAAHQQAGVDLSGYTMPGVVKDMEAARVALGYAKINLFSESYGTRVAQIYAYLHPDSLHRLVLIGVNTPGHFIYDPAVLDKMIGHISELCARDASCSSRTSDFGQTMYTVNHNMPKRWLFFNIDSDTVRFAAHALFFSNSNMTALSDAYLSAAAGDPSGLAIINLVMPMLMPTERMMFGDSFNKGGTADLDKYSGIESISLGNSIMGAPWSELIWPLASEWPIELLPQNLREFQKSDTEMLLVNGTVDFSTPPTALDEAKPYFHKAQMVLLPEFSHVDDEYTLQPEAFHRLITSYYDTGVADDSLYVYQPISFEPGLSLTLMAKLLVAGMIVLPALIIVGVVLGVRRIRRRRTAKSQRATKPIYTEINEQPASVQVSGE